MRWTLGEDDGALPRGKPTQCKCRNSKCLKLYCECFASGIYCGPRCLCTNCENNFCNE